MNLAVYWCQLRLLGDAYRVLEQLPDVVLFQKYCQASRQGSLIYPCQYSSFFCNVNGYLYLLNLKYVSEVLDRWVIECFDAPS